LPAPIQGETAAPQGGQTASVPVAPEASSRGIDGVPKRPCIRRRRESPSNGIFTCAGSRTPDRWTSPPPRGRGLPGSRTPSQRHRCAHLRRTAWPSDQGASAQLARPSQAITRPSICAAAGTRSFETSRSSARRGRGIESPRRGVGPAFGPLDPALSSLRATPIAS